MSCVNRNPRHMNFTVAKRRKLVNKFRIKSCIVHLGTELVIDTLDNLKNSREQEAENRYIPLLKSLSHDSMVCIRKGILYNIPCFFPLHAVLIHQKPH